MFLLLVFGKMVEEDLGKRALIGSFFICGVLSNIFSLWYLPTSSISMGSSGAIFGLYSLSVLAKLRKIKSLDAEERVINFVESSVFGYFVAATLLHEMKMHSSTSSNVN
eukprot:CAMPEP_0171482226 /NCGR_PEP_ID=MMETSP0946-20130122/7317_1 /TAXON_ID=109269 /ORGANISM="Vaucheria litorea, Strain CCMP2940" /LENGTH=108 /DNA_ID=CAMNT_0012014153 /DNA_START=72 /DNA_END=395 /DNA_ORIENTATION=+